MRKLVMTQFKYKTCKNYQSEEIKYGEDITFEGFPEKLELIIIEGITIIRMSRQGTEDEQLSYDRKLHTAVSKQ